MFERRDDGPVTVLTLRHGKANAMDAELLEGLATTIGSLEDEGRALVLTGDGSIFSAGVDLDALVDGGETYVRPFLDRLDEMVRTVFAFRRPLVAAVNGHALAGGFVLAQLADVVVAADGSAKLGLPELPVGVLFPPTVLEALRHRLPMPTLEWLVLSGRAFGPAEALARGAVDELAAPDELVATAVSRARALCGVSPAQYAYTKLQLRDEALRRMDAPERRAEIADWWCRPETLDQVRNYLAALRAKR